MAKWVYLFSEGNASMRELLGGKGANLAAVSYTHLLCGNESDYGGKFYGVYRIRWQSDTGKPVYL